MTHPTPRTDALYSGIEARAWRRNPSGLHADDIFDLAEHARQLEIENAELVEALRGMLECMRGCEVFIHSRQKINQQEGPGWIASFTDRARAAIAMAEGNSPLKRGRKTYRDKARCPKGHSIILVRRTSSIGKEVRSWCPTCRSHFLAVAGVRGSSNQRESYGTIRDEKPGGGE